MAYWNGFVPGQSLPPATMPDKTSISLRNNLFPGQGVTLDGNWSLAEGAIALQRDAWTKSQQVMTQHAAIESHAKAKAEVEKAKAEKAKARTADAEALEAEAKARKANAEASLAEAEVKEKIRAAKAEADARIRVAEAEEANKIRVDEAETTTKIRVAAAEAREADLKILKLGKEIDVFTENGQANEQADVEKVVEKPKKQPNGRRDHPVGEVGEDILAIAAYYERKERLRPRRQSAEKGQGNEQADVEKVVEKPKKRARTGNQLEPLQGARVVEDEAAENNEAGESDAIIEEDEPSAPAGPAQLVAAENQGSVKRRKVAEPADLQNSVQPQNHPSGVLTFPLKLSTASLRSRWTQQRYENGQKFLFVALMDKKAFSRENAINRQALRQAVQTRGIGDLGLVDHIIKTLTEVPVLFSGYWIRKQHSHKGVLHYWLSQEVPGVNTVGLNQQQNEGLQIGQRIEVHFDDPPDYFPGTITGKDKGRWQIEYDDGDREELDLSTTKYRLLRGEGLIAGPKAHKAAKPTKRKGTRPTRRGLTLLDLMKKGLMEPGQGVLRVEYKGHVFLGDLTPSGSICYEGELWESPTSWSMHVKRRVSPGMKVDNGWESVFYVAKDGGEIITLKQLRSTHALKMVGSGSFEKETATAPKVKPALAA